MKTLGFLFTVGLLVMGGIAVWRFVDRTADALGPANIRTLVFVVVGGVLFIAALAASSLPIKAARWQPDRPEKFFYTNTKERILDGRSQTAPQVHFLPHGAGNALWPDQVVNAVNQRAYQIGQADRLLLDDADAAALAGGAAYSLAELDAAGSYAEW